MGDATRTDPLAEFRHHHNHGVAASSHETRTRWVVAQTFAMMVLELVVGYATNSLALTADGWHMATHAGALGMAAFAYWFARRYSESSAIVSLQHVTIEVNPLALRYDPRVAS